MSLHSSLVIPSSVSKSLRVSASFLACADERRSVYSLAGGVGLRGEPTFEVLDEIVERRANFQVDWNWNLVESLEPSKDNRYEVDPCRMCAYGSFQLTVGF